MWLHTIRLWPMHPPTSTVTPTLSARRPSISKRAAHPLCSRARTKIFSTIRRWLNRLPEPATKTRTPWMLTTGLPKEPCKMQRWAHNQFWTAVIQTPSSRRSLKEQPATEITKETKTHSKALFSAQPLPIQPTEKSWAANRKASQSCSAQTNSSTQSAALTTILHQLMAHTIKTRTHHKLKSK